MSGRVQHSTKVHFDDAGRIDQDLPCIGCEYNLRMQPAEAACPECGTAVGRSVQAWLLSGNSLTFLRRVRFSLLSIAIGVGLICLLPLPVLFGISSHPEDEWAFPLFAIASVCLIVGAWFGLAHDRTRRSLPPWQDLTRSAARIGMITGPVLFFVMVALGDWFKVVEIPVLVALPVLLITPLSICVAVLYHGVTAHRLAGLWMRRCLAGVVVFSAACFVAWAAIHALISWWYEQFGHYSQWIERLDWLASVLSWSLLVAAVLGIWIMIWLRLCIGRVVRDRRTQAILPPADAVEPALPESRSI